MTRAKIIALVLCTVCASRHADAAAPRITITFAPEIRSETVSIEYYRFGPFGAAGNVVSPVPNVHAYDIDPFYMGRLATDIKSIVWVPGCQFEVFDIPIVGESPIEERYDCSPLPTAYLAGSIAPNKLMRGRNLEVVIRYLGFWECGFFGLADCSVPQMQVARVPLKEDGTFEATITDFSGDRSSSENSGSAELWVILRDAKTWNPIGTGLRPPKDLSSTSVAGLAIKPFYPVPVVFEIIESDTNSANTSAQPLAP